MHFHAAIMLAYNWLVAQNLWKAVVGWVVGIVLTATFVQRPWRKHRKAQARISDQLDVDTPGGLETVVSLQKRILTELEAHRKDDGEGNPGRS